MKQKRQQIERGKQLIRALTSELKGSGLAGELFRQSSTLTSELKELAIGQSKSRKSLLFAERK